MIAIMGSIQEQLYDQEIHTVVIPEDVRRSGKATSELIAEAVAFLHKDGIVILENAIDTAHIDILNNMLSKEALEIAADPDHHFNFGRETRNMVCAGMFGPPVIHYANGNTALKATGRQPVHSDCEFAHPRFPFAMVLNINLVDTSPENGSTEFWPGSHHYSTVDDHVGADSPEHQLVIKKDYVEARRKHSPPIQPRTKKGSMIIRDLRLWHAGMPNKTDVPRVMLAFVAQPAWFRGRAKVLLPKSVKDLIDSWSDEFQFDAEWVDGEVDHKKVKSTHVDFDTKSEALAKYREELAHRPPYQPAIF